MDDLEPLAAEIRNADTAAVLTGAGISAPSGVPTFRGDDGVWDAFDEGQFTYGRFQRDPAGFWEDRVELYRTMFAEEYEPNAAHDALAELTQEGMLESVLTQNTDELHAKAAAQAETVDGTGQNETGIDEFASHESILELHGNARRVRCSDCGAREASDPIVERAEAGELPPRCECGGVYKPDVVLFGEQLSKAILQRARSLARESDVFLAVGSSLEVEPAASLPRLASSTGGTLAIINLESTPCDNSATMCFRRDVIEVLPRLRELTSDNE
ncbi:Sir2 family NAD-dependent protein deacetylase [Saliphagus sp. LR7]|uniref:SIR2 family NAD-dependent protein deacylase n=1 Tax=Saliphagus sp. LR7 TaxID=2282654 RepID=UPI000DF81A84|nr:Sir2 family NAD-dependent protein deacetylase [Saliphagus sp. LR7]